MEKSTPGEMYDRLGKGERIPVLSDICSSGITLHGTDYQL